MNVRTSRAALGSLLVIWMGWLLVTIVWAPARLVVLPQPLYLTRQIVSMLTG